MIYGSMRRNSTRALAACIPIEMPRRGLEMAVDFHDDPIMARPRRRGVYQPGRGQRRHDLLLAHRHAVCDLAGRADHPGDDLCLAGRGYRVERASVLMKRRASLGFRPRSCIWTRASAREHHPDLQRANLPAVIACPIRAQPAAPGCAGVGNTIAPATLQRRHDGGSGRGAHPDHGQENRKPRRTWLNLRHHFTWIGRPRSLTSATTPLRHRISYRQLGQVRVHSNSATLPCASFSWHWASSCSTSGPIYAACVPGSWGRGRSAWR